MKRFIPLHTAGFDEPTPEAVARRWEESFGGNIVWWERGAVGTWLREEPKYYQAGDPQPIPQSAFTPGCDRFQVERARKLYIVWLRTEAPAVSSSGREATTLLERCTEEYIRQRPFDHQLTARLRLLRTFLVHAGPPLPFPAWSEIRCPGLQCGIKLCFAVTYGSVLVLGVLGLAPFLLSGCWPEVLIALSAVFLILFFPLGIRIVDPRYLASAYPLLGISAGCFIAVRCEKFVGRVSRAVRGHD
jgi:hypothetical protein